MLENEPSAGVADMRMAVNDEWLAPWVPVSNAADALAWARELKRECPVGQRLRNRIMEELLGLSEGDAHVREVWPTEWFESFFDYFEYEGDVHPRAALSTISAEERDRLTIVVSLMQEALRNTPSDLTDDELIATGWLARIARAAALFSTHADRP